MESVIGVTRIRYNITRYGFNTPENMKTCSRVCVTIDAVHFLHIGIKSITRLMWTFQMAFTK